MLHTIYITSPIISEKSYNNIYNNLKIISKNRGYNLYKESENLYLTNAFADLGIKEVRLRKTKIARKYNYYNKQIEMLVNPKRLIEKKNKIDITKAEDIEEISKEFNKIMQSISTDLPSFFNFTIQRIDYCINIETEYVEEYIKLFQRADRPSIYFKELYDNKTHRRGQRQGSFYLKSNSVNINFYNKEEERLNNNILDNNSKNILRLEVQCKKEKTNNIKFKKQFRTKNLLYFFNKDLSREIIEYYYKKTVGKEDYYKLNKAIELIKASKNSETMKEKMITVLKEVNKKRSVVIARQESIYNKANFNRYLKKIRTLNINVVTIPESWKINKLENLLTNL